MSENTRDIKVILEELFKGAGSALTKYAKVRMTQYEINLWRKEGMPLEWIDKSAKSYFSTRFLGGKRITNTTPAELQKACDALDHAVKDGCHGRCVKLVAELNEAFTAIGLSPIKQIDKFLDFVTFYYEVRKDEQGNAIKEKPNGFEVRVFQSDTNRKELWTELQLLMKQNRMMSIPDVSKIVLNKRHLSKSLK